MVDCEPTRILQMFDLTPWLANAPYLSPSCVTVDAGHQSARIADYQHLEEPDLLWTGAILADKAQKDCQD